MAIGGDILALVAQMAMVLVLAPSLTGLVRKAKAHLLRRQGPPIVQPYRNLFRLLRKEPAMAMNASWLFRAAPYLVFALVWVAASMVPGIAIFQPFGSSADVIAVIALLASARFFLALAGLDIGTSFGGIGASREMMIGSLAEPAMLMVVFTLALVAGSTNISGIAQFLMDNFALRASVGLALVGFMIVAIAENARIPVDNPATHLELTMVHEAMVLEYSGRHLALIEWAASLKLLLYVSLLVALFAPFGMAPYGASAVEGAIAVSAYLAKLVAGGLVLAFFEVTIAKMRVFRVPEFLGAALMLGLLATLLELVARSL